MTNIFRYVYHVEHSELTNWWMQSMTDGLCSTVHVPMRRLTAFSYCEIDWVLSVTQAAVSKHWEHWHQPRRITHCPHPSLIPVHTRDRRDATTFPPAIQHLHQVTWQVRARPLSWTIAIDCMHGQHAHGRLPGQAILAICSSCCYTIHYSPLLTLLSRTHSHTSSTWLLPSCVSAMGLL